MLDDDAVKERQRQTVPGSTAQYNSGSAGTKAAGNRKTAQYGDAAGQSGRAALYSSPSAVKPAIGNQKATPYGSAAAALYSSPAAAEPAVQKREKTPSERGEEVIRAMLEDGGLPEPPEPEGNEAPAARTFTTGVGRSDIIGPAANAGEDAGPIPATPEELMLAAAPDFAAAGIDTSVLQAGLTLGNTAKQLWDDTQIAPGMPVSAYLLDRVGNAMDTVLEGAWNGIVDYAQAGVNADLERQKQQAQQFSFLGGPYQTYADQITDTARSIQEALPEAAEKFRSHKAAEQAQRIEIQKVGRDLQNDRGKALSSKETHDILNNKSDSTTHAQKEWWEEPGASEPIDPDNPTYQAMNAKLTDNDRAAGLRVVKIDGEYYIDYTVVINTRLHEVEQDFRNHGTHNQSIYNPAIFYPAIHNQGLRLANTAWFISQVNNNRPWDIKLKGPWLQQFGYILPLKRMEETIAYNGQVVTPENLGNLTYGYLGRSMGWSEEALCLGGGVVNQKNLAEEEAKGVEGKIPQLITQLKFLNPSLYFDGSYGDEEKDTLFIKKGVELYEAVH